MSSEPISKRKEEKYFDLKYIGKSISDKVPIKYKKEEKEKKEGWE